MSKNTRGLKKLYKPSEALSRIVGSKALSRPEVTALVWKYIKGNELQDEDDRRYFNTDSVLTKVFGSGPIHMLEVQKHLSSHLKALE